jgi:outer membrane lipoprotein SlyB
MKKLLLASVIISIVSVTGCARRSQVIIDPHGVDMGMYQQDLAECTNIANQVDSKVGGGIVGGAVVGAIAGSIIGGNRTTDKMAKLGALSGGVKGGAATRYERNKVIKNCLRNRGYQVLN